MSILTLLADILYVGHSLVGPTLPAIVEAGLARQGVEMTVSAQVINGAPLRYGWDHSDQGERGDARRILPGGQTKVLILTEAQPLGEQIQWNDSAGYVEKFARLAWEARPDTQVYLYETWPSRNIAEGLPWREQLTADLPAWESLAGRANAARPPQAPPVRLIPAGQAMGALADAVVAGQVPGISSVDDLFDDDIHPSGRALSFLALVHIAAITGKDPSGLPALLTRHWPSRDAVLTDAQAAAFQRIAWKVVSDYRTGEVVRESAAAAQVVPVPAKSPDQPAVQGVTNPRLALGLSGVTDWSVQQPFLDLMKTARPWVGHAPGRWGGVEFETLRDAGALDEHGWPRTIPDGATGLSTLILTDLPADAGGVAGRYVLRHAGRGELVVKGRASVVEEAEGRVVFDYVPGAGSVEIVITALDAADPVRDISVVRQDRVAAVEAGAIFNPDWLERIRGVRGLRFMDWMATNNSTLSTLAQRPVPDDFSWAVKGVPVEVMIALANELRADAWFTLPHLADDALVRGYALAVRDGLAPGLRAQVEFSNEVWNWQFAQAAWADRECRARWQAADCWMQYYGMRAAEVMDIWADVFGDEAEARLTRIVAVQTGWMGLEQQVLEAPLVVAEGRDPPARHFDAYAVTGYFAGSLGAEEKADLLQGWLGESRAAAMALAAQQGLTGAAAEAFVAAHRFDLATERAAAELENGSVTGQPADTLASLLDTVLPYHADIAKQHGLELIMYEGGTHVVATAGRLLEDAEVTAFFHHLNYSAHMGRLYGLLQEGWARLSAAPFNAFVDVYAPTKWGSWGALRHLGDANPRWDALAHGCRTC